MAIEEPPGTHAAVVLTGAGSRRLRDVTELLCELRGPKCCPFCEKTYLTNKAFKRHLVTLHASIIAENSLNLNYLVKFPNKFITTSALRIEMSGQYLICDTNLKRFLQRQGIIVVRDVKFLARFNFSDDSTKPINIVQQHYPFDSEENLFRKSFENLDESDIISSEVCSEPSSTLEQPTSVDIEVNLFREFCKNLDASDSIVTGLSDLLETICAQEKCQPSLSCFLNVQYIRKCFEPSKARKFCKIIIRILLKNNFSNEQCEPLLHLHTSERKNTETGMGTSVKERSLGLLSKCSEKFHKALQTLFIDTLKRAGELSDIYRKSLSSEFILASNFLALKCASYIGHTNTGLLVCDAASLRQQFCYNKKSVFLPQTLLVSMDKFIVVRQAVQSNIPNLFINSKGKPLYSGYSAATLKRLC